MYPCKFGPNTSIGFQINADKPQIYRLIHLMTLKMGQNHQKSRILLIPIIQYTKLGHNPVNGPR